MTPSQKNEKALVALRLALDPGKHMDFRRAIQEAITALSQPTTGEVEVWYVTDRPDQNGEYGVWLGRHTCAIGATDKSSAIRLCNLLNAKQLPTPLGGEVVTVKTCEKCKLVPATCTYSQNPGLRVCESCYDRLNDEFDEDYS